MNERATGSTGQIVAMGGGGFSEEPTNLALDRYVLDRANCLSPRVCFLGAASGDSEGYVRRFYGAMAALRARPSDLSLFRPHTADLRGFLHEQEVIYVGGGNTRSLLALWREWGLDVILREFWQAGRVLAGISAGAICWFEQGVTDSIPGAMTPLSCLGLLPGSACPHYDSESERRPFVLQAIAAGVLANGYAMDDGAAIHFVGTRFAGAVASRADAKVYRVERQGDVAIERELPIEVLPPWRGLPLARRSSP